jgi:hypothetical protein
MTPTLTGPFVPGHADSPVALVTKRSCGHVRHVGPCPSCQRAQLTRWNAQLAEASRAGRGR